MSQQGVYTILDNARELCRQVSLAGKAKRPSVHKVDIGAAIRIATRVPLPPQEAREEDTILAWRKVNGLAELTRAWLVEGACPGPDLQALQSVVLIVVRAIELADKARARACLQTGRA